MMRYALSAFSALALAGCTQTSEIGVPPTLSPVGYGANPVAMNLYHYPTPPPEPVKKYSLWQDSQSDLFTDARALQRGDILTVKINIEDSARFQNASERERTSTRGLGVGAQFGWEWLGTSGEADADINSTSIYDGSGRTARSEELDLSVAAVVTDVLPNGNLVISGSQEVRVNAELRVLTIAGIVRPNDITARNTVPYDRIAEARISYGGRGRLTEVQQPPYGQQILDAVLPF